MFVDENSKIQTGELGSKYHNYLERKDYVIN